MATGDIARAIGGEEAVQDESVHQGPLGGCGGKHGERGTAAQAAALSEGIHGDQGVKHVAEDLAGIVRECGEDALGAAAEVAFSTSPSEV